METKTRDGGVLAADESADVCGTSSRRSTTVCWSKLLAVLLMLSIVFQVYEHVRLSRLEQRQCDVRASADRDMIDSDDDDDKVRLSLSARPPLIFRRARDRIVGRFSAVIAEIT